MLNILSFSSEEYAVAVKEHLGKGERHAKILYKEWFTTGRVSCDNPAFNNCPSLFQDIVTLTDFSLPSLVKKGDERRTEKYLLDVGQGLEVEMVTLPMKAGWTLCVSSQVGCRMGCAFCETGKMGLLRSLTAEEIVAQLFHARHSLGVDIRNIVFMGMGEPLDNFEAVMGAVKVFTDPHGFGLGPRHVTISTSGVVENIYRLIEVADQAINLAVSINAPNDRVRNRLMPVNKKADMAELRRAMEAYCKHPRRKILAEYVLIEGYTDGEEAAEELADYLEGLPVTINLIPYNPQSRDVFSPPTDDEVKAFEHRLRERGYLVFVRGTKGQKIMAACGQLGNLKSKKKRLAFSRDATMVGS